MKIVIEIPDTTVGAFLNYVYYTSTPLSMMCKSISTDEIQSDKVIVCNPETKEEK